MAKIIQFPKRRMLRERSTYYDTHDCIHFINQNELKKAALALSIILGTEIDIAEKSLSILTQGIRQDKNKLEIFLDLEEVLSQQTDVKVALLLLYDLFGLEETHAQRALHRLRKTYRLKP